MTAEQTKQLIERTAFDFRQSIRAIAGLKCDWMKASKTMKDWYRWKAREALESEGRI